MVVGWGAAALSRRCRLCLASSPSWRLLEEFPSTCLFVALCALGNLDTAFTLVSFSLRCLGVALSTLYSGRVLGSTVDTCLREAFGELHIFSTCGALSSWRSSPFRRMEKCAQLMLRVAVSLRALHTLNLDIISTSSSCDGVG